MTLGQNIYNLRKKNNLSQGDLAERLDVSRQSVSKWETDASVPDLDKLVGMSEVFGITLDDLIKGDAVASEEGAKSQPTTWSMNGLSSGRMAAVIILMILGGLAFLLFTGFGGLLTGLIVSAPFICCGIICIVSRKRPLLWCSWALYIIIDAYLSFATGAGSAAFFTYLIYTGLTAQTVVAGVRWLVYLALTVFTVLSFCKYEIKNKKRAMVWFFICVGAIICLHIISYFFGEFMHGILYSDTDLTVGDSDHQRFLMLSGIYYTLSTVLDWLKSAAFVSVLSLAIPTFKKNK